ncbi:MAG: ASCH domain-containing protein [Desulfovibrionaceae bacterium]|nr:ASCH domain-containing protein [Desulfovibrionaceae bacterium]
MKALSVRQPWASLIALNYKTVELRSWKTKYRGELLICSSLGDLILKNKTQDLVPGGFALALVELYEVRKTIKEDLQNSLMPAATSFSDIENDYAWLLRNVREIHPFQVKGKLNFYQVEEDLIHPLPAEFKNHLEYFKAINYKPNKIKSFQAYSCPLA